MNHKVWMLVVGVLWSGVGAIASILPPNDMNIPDYSEKELKMMKAGKRSGLTHVAFERVISRVKGLYESSINRMGYDLAVEDRWEDGTVNAYAHRDTPETMTVVMFGGLARHPLISEDGFALVMCHELGHHIGGAPYYQSGGVNEWASNEGQSDYFGANTCMKKYFNEYRGDRPSKQDKNYAPAEKLCHAKYRGLKDRRYCIRTQMAGASLAAVLNDLAWLPGPKPLIANPSNYVTPVMVHSHPPAQCRLDTYVNGSLVKARPGCWFKK